VYVDGDVAWIGAGATRPAFRRRGGQSALLAARVARALELGARTLVTETGARVDDRRHTSYDNILRTGFREQYLRDNWLAP
jgi:GNAT superfamily N-acetyltransferase